jgi:hypothetical protein
VGGKFPFAMGPKIFLGGPGVRVMVFNATFNNISAIWWRSILSLGGNLSTQRKSLTRRA